MTTDDRTPRNCTPPPPPGLRTLQDRLEEDDPYCDPICCCEAEPRWQKVGEDLDEQQRAREAAGA